MIYFENASRGEEGLNTHVMSWTMCVALSNFLDRDFYFDYELPSSTPPAYAFEPKYRERFRLLMESPRSLVSELVKIPNRRVLDIERDVASKKDFQLLYSHFGTTQEMRKRFEGTIIWDSFSVGRIPVVKEELAEIELIEWTHTKLSSPAIFFFLPREEKRSLLDSVRIKYLDSIERLAAEIVSDLGEYYAIHLRLGDYSKNYEPDGYTLEARRVRDYIDRVFVDTDLPVLVATDGLHEGERFAELLAGRRFTFIDEAVFEGYFDRYRELEFTDFNVLSIINQLICSAAEKFIGTYRSTFTGVIHRIRQERYGRKDFEFFPDLKVATLIGDQGTIAPDRHGFFDWNRYSVFAENHSAMSWMREWDHTLSAIDL